MPLDKDTRIKRQVEFYFADSNFRRDRFLRGVAESNDGWVPIASLLTFSRMKMLEATPEDVVRIMESSDVVNLNDEKTKLKRSKPLPAVDDSNERTIYIKGFPTDATLDTIEESISNISNIARIQMRRDKDKAFKGSCFIEFHTVEAAHAAIKDGMKFGDKDLENAVLIEAYKAEKRAERQQEKLEKARAAARGGKVFVAGAIIKLSGMSESVDRNKLKDYLRMLAAVKFVDSDREPGITYVRCPSAEDSQRIYQRVKQFIDARASADAAATAGESSVDHGSLLPAAALTAFAAKIPTSVELLEGDDEKKYWEECVWKSSAPAPKKKRSRDDDKTESTAKVVKAEEGADAATTATAAATEEKPAEEAVKAEETVKAEA